MNSTVGVIENWSKHVVDLQTYLIGVVIFDAQVGDEHKPLQTVGPINYMDKDSGLVQTNTRLLRLGREMHRSRSENRRLFHQVTHLDS